jgi:hypothetical protein
MDNLINYLGKGSNNNNNTPLKNNNGNAKGLYNFVYINIIWFILAIFLGLIIFYIVYLIKKRKKIGHIKIKPNYNVYRVDDDIKHDPVPNKELECPMEVSKYSFAFFLELNDFYCDTGYWKAIMIKGQELNKNNIKCGTYRDDSNKQLYNCFDEYEDVKKDELETYIKGDSTEQNQNSINIEEDLNKRVHLICKAHNLDLENSNSDAKNRLCHAASNCGLFTNNNGEVVKMSQGQCINFINEHKDYCNMVYKVDEKVARDSSLIVKANKDKTKRYYNDEYDNICSQDNLIDKYPELLPKNLDSLKEIKLINLAEKMDIKNGENKEDKSLEGCYDFAKLTEIIGSIKNTEIIKDTGIPTLDNNNILAECNRYTLDKSNYFGINDDKCFTIDLNKETTLIDLVNKNENIKKKNKECDGRQPVNKKNIFISKALRPEENILLKCWENIINIYPTQNPGIWLHPYINDLRIIVTTQSGNTETDYEQYINEIIHPYKETSFSKLRNYNIEPLGDDVFNKDAHYSPTESIKKCDKGGFTNVLYYREYFDVKNIPIKEKFHLSLVINEKLVEIYINGNLHTSQILFGDPKYNSGPLHISPGKKDSGGDLKLNGVITDFKYYTHAINYINIKNIIEEKSIVQNNNGVILSAEHTHNVEIGHDHHHDVLNEAEHKHGISDENVKTDYYLED